MPKIIIDYSNTIIYKITCKDTENKDVYVGHTRTLFKGNTVTNKVVTIRNHQTIIVKCIIQFVKRVVGIIG